MWMGLFNRAKQRAEMPDELDHVVPLEETDLFKQKASVLSSVRAIAAEKGAQPTLLDYLDACKSYQHESTEWHPKIYADLTGQDLSGFAISDPSKLPNDYPNKLIGGALADSKNESDKRPIMDRLYDAYDDKTVNEFYANLNFHRANLEKTLIAPATSFLVAEKDGAQIDGATFDSMGQQVTFAIGSGHHKNINVTNANGVNVKLKPGADVDQIDINGTWASISLESNATLSHVSVNEGFRIAEIKAEPGAILRDSDLREATISMASRMNGIVMENVKFGNINDVGLQKATLHHVQINGNVDHANFTSALLFDVTINGSVEDAKFKNARITQAVIHGNVDDANFNGATLTDASITGSIKNGKFSESKLRQTVINGDTDDANFNESTLTGLTINGSIKGASFSGADITDLRVNGVLIRDAEQLKELGAKVEGSVAINVTPQAEAQEVGTLASATWMNPAYDPSQSVALASRQQQQARSGRGV